MPDDLSPGGAALADRTRSPAPAANTHAAPAAALALALAPAATLPLTAQAPVTIAVDAVGLVATECITVTSAMRKHARWAHSSVAAILGGGSKWAAADGASGSGSGSGGEQQQQQQRQRRRPAVATAAVAAAAAAVAGAAEAEDEAAAGGGAGRWGLRGKKGRSLQDNPLMSAFTKLRSDLKDCKGGPRRCVANVC
jgi:brefeldin A-resistance guanine nucleotide exchange factor 1